MISRGQLPSRVRPLALGHSPRKWRCVLHHARTYRRQTSLHCLRLTVVLQWDALYDMLFELATSAGATVTYGAHTVGLAPGTEKNQKPTLAFADGSTYTADVVVGADGVNSTIRGLVTDHLGPRAGSFEPEAMTAYRFGSHYRFRISTD